MKQLIQSWMRCLVVFFDESSKEILSFEARLILPTTDHIDPGIYLPN